MKTQTLTDARKEILTGHPFSMEFCAYDKKRNTGGERIIITGCRLMQTPEDREEIVNPAPREQQQFKSRKAPRHLSNNTFNVLLASGKPQKVHWLMMEVFNGKKVIL